MTGEATRRATGSAHSSAMQNPEFGPLLALPWLAQASILMVDDVPDLTG